MNPIVEKVENFIQHLRNLDYVVSLEATKMWYDRPSEENSLFSRQVKTNLTDNLANAISMYEGCGDDENEKLRYAIIALVWINKAFACGVIQEGQGSAKKIEDLQKKNEQLQKDLEQLSSDYIRLRAFTDQFIKYVKLPSESESGDENERKSP